MAANEDMDGVFLGGGAIEHVVAGGDVYLKASHVGQLLSQTGTRMALAALQENDPNTAMTAQFVMIISEKIYELRSELLKREIEKSLSLGDFNDFFDGI